MSREEFLSRNRGATLTSNSSNGSKELPQFPPTSTSIPPFSPRPPPTIIVNDDETEMELLRKEAEERTTNQRGGSEDGGGDVATTATSSFAPSPRRPSRFEITPVPTQEDAGKVQNMDSCSDQGTQLVQVDWKGDRGEGKKGASDPNSMERRQQQLEQSHFILPGFPVKSILKSPTTNAFGYPSSNSASTVTYGL